MSLRTYLRLCRNPLVRTLPWVFTTLTPIVFIDGEGIACLTMSTVLTGPLAMVSTEPLLAENLYILLFPFLIK